MKYLKYFRYLIVHKWHVFIACLRYGIVWQGITHDLSKFLPDELFPYIDYFNSNPKDHDAFDYAWLKHQHRNPHHWQFWILVNDNDGTYPLQMPDKYAKEMLCDWIGADKTKKLSGVGAWYEANKNKMVLHTETRRWIEQEIYK